MVCLLSAARNANPEMMKVLVEAGADVNGRDFVSVLVKLWSDG